MPNGSYEALKALILDGGKWGGKRSGSSKQPCGYTGRVEAGYDRRMDDPLTAITEILHDEHGIPVAKLRPTARLGHDLGVDGDDASDLFQRLHERFGTDFSALNEQWTVFFHNEGGSLRGLLWVFTLMIPSTALTVWIATMFDLSTHLGGVIGIVMFFASWLCAGRLLPSTPKRNVTIEGLAQVVQAGPWPDDVTKLR